MKFRSDLTTEVKSIFSESWQVQETDSVPDPEDLRFGNHAKDLKLATVLYADLNGSTKMVDSKKWTFSAEVYKAYLRCAARIINNEEGVISAYDGDRIMAIFTGDYKNTTAVRTAMKINLAVREIINPELKIAYKDTDFQVNHVIGIDTTQLRTARIGVRGYNDLVWIGRAANYAAKLTDLTNYSIWITKTVYDSMSDAVKIHNQSKENMWKKHIWTAMNKLEIYGTNYRYEL